MVDIQKHLARLSLKPCDLGGFTMEKPHPLGSENAHCNLTYWPTDKQPSFMPPNPCRVLLKEKESNLNVVRWLTCGRWVFLTLTQLKWRPPWDIVCPMRFALIFLRSIHRVSILAIVQVKSVPIARKQIRFCSCHGNRRSHCWLLLTLHYHYLLQIICRPMAVIVGLSITC